MKTIYMAHPVAGAVKFNLAKARLWLRWLAESREEPTNVIAPWITACEIWDDTNPEERAARIECCKATIELCAEIWFVGGKIQSGGESERRHAMKHGVTVVDVTCMGEWPPDVTEEEKIRIRFVTSPQIAIPDGTTGITGHEQRLVRMAIDHVVRWDCCRVCKAPGTPGLLSSDGFCKACVSDFPDGTIPGYTKVLEVQTDRVIRPNPNPPKSPVLCGPHSIALPCYRCGEDAERLAEARAAAIDDAIDDPRHADTDYPSPYGIGGPPPPCDDCGGIGNFPDPCGPGRLFCPSCPLGRQLQECAVAFFAPGTEINKIKEWLNKHTNTTGPTSPPPEPLPRFTCSACTVEISDPNELSHWTDGDVCVPCRDRADKELVERVQDHATLRDATYLSVSPKECRRLLVAIRGRRSP